MKDLAGHKSLSTAGRHIRIENKEAQVVDRPVFGVLQDTHKILDPC